MGDNGHTSVGTTYARWVLDCVIEAAHAVSRDFSARPQLYRSVEVGSELTELQSAIGFRAKFPDLETRGTLLQPLFGQSDGRAGGNDGSPFQTARAAVLGAAAAFSENAQPTGFPMLRERIRSAAVPFRSHLEDVQGSSLAETERRTSSLFDLSSRVLRDRQVAAVFGVQREIDAQWPLAAVDTEGAKLLENIAAQLGPFEGRELKRDGFIRLQRLAGKGAESIELALGSDLETDDAAVDAFTQKAYAWGTDLGLVGSGAPPPIG